jgi:hypothetical protein
MDCKVAVSLSNWLILHLDGANIEDLTLPAKMGSLDGTMSCLTPHLD